MLPRAFLLLLILGLIVGSGWVINYLKIGQKPSTNGILVSPTPASSVNEIKPKALKVDKAAVPYRLEVVTENLEVPWSVAFTSEKRMLVTERPGRVRVIENGKVVSQPLVTFGEVSAQDEAGLMGLALDPDYQKNQLFYVCLTYSKAGRLWNKIVSLKDQQVSDVVEKIILDETPAAHFHAGCRVKFGPDGKLYVTSGDATEKNLAQDLNSRAGKILRLNADGSIPGDNPRPGSPIFSYGHRNPQGIDWHPVSGSLWASEHGPSGFDGPGGGDEINLIKPGENYGWPLVSHEKDQPGLMAPKLVFTPAVAPSGLLIYKGDLLPQFKNDVLFAALKGEGIYHVRLSEDNPDVVESYQKLPEVNVGRVREIIEGPEGAIYFTTSNRDGRGKPRGGDDKVYRMVPM